MIPWPTYPAHARYAAAAGDAALWRTAAGALMIVTVYLGFLAFLMGFLDFRYGEVITFAIVATMARGDSAGGMLLLLFSFTGLALGALTAARFFRGRPAGHLFGADPRRALSDGLRVTGAVLMIHLALVPFLLSDPAVTRNLAAGRFLSLLPFALACLLVQVVAEELVFRGFAQQQLARRFASPAIWMGLPSAVFAWGHYSPHDFGANAWAIALWAALFGCLAADLTARTGSLGAAIGFHLANNIAALLLVAPSGTMDGLALWQIALDPAAPEGRTLLLVDLGGMIVAWLAARLALRV